MVNVRLNWDGRELIAAPLEQAVTKLRGRVFEEKIEWESMLRGILWGR